jgi:tetratricopeptide (TPR) repeat protein
MAAEKYPMALDEITSAEKIVGSNKAVLKIKAESQRKLNRHSDAIATLTAFLKLEPKDYVALVDRADSNFALNQYEQAFVDAQAAYEARNFDERVISFYAKTAFFHNNYAEVKKIGKRCVELFSKNESCFEFLGRASYQTKEYPAAIKFFESALNLNSTQQEVRLLYAEALALNGNEQESDAQFAEALKRYPNYEMAMKSWAKFLTQRKKVEALGVALRKYCDKNPSSVWASVELSKLLFLVGDQETGLDRMDTVTSENKSDLGKFFFAYFLDASGKHKKARNNLESIKDKSLDVDFHMGIAFAKDKRFQDAIKHWSKIKVDSPNYFKSQINIALANEQMGQVVKAKELLTTLAIAVPSEYKVALEQKINSMGSEDRKPANENQRGISFFLDWSLPQI